MNPYEAIYVRKSVRDFQKKKITQEDQQCIREYVDAMSPLYEGMQWKIELVEDRKAVGGLWKVQAPMYLVFCGTSEEPEAYYNAGYMMENLLLFLHTKGIGSCYQGGLEWKKQPKEDEMFPLLIAAIGYGEKEISRKPQEFKRKSFGKLVSVREQYSNDIAQMLESARLAPSAMNTRPWSFVVYHNRIHLFIESSKRNAPVHLVDMGICMSHLALAAEELWVAAEFLRVDSLVEKKIHKYHYVTSVIIQ